MSAVTLARMTPTLFPPRSRLPLDARRAIPALLAAAVVLAGSAGARGEDGSSAGLTVSVVRAVPRCLKERIAASGVFVARHDVEVRSDREGLMVSELTVEPGDLVSRSQVLARLAPAQGGSPEIVRAPVDGILLAATATVGAYVDPKQADPLFRIAEAGELELKAELLASGLSRLRPGMEAKLRVIGLGDLDARLATIEDGVNATTQLGTLHLSVAPNANLRVGMFARAEIDVGKNCGLTVPLSALLYGANGAVVGIVQRGRVVMRSVTTGLLDGNSIGISSGLAENDLVIARAGTFLRDDDRVHAMEMPPDGRSTQITAGGDRSSPGRP